MSKFSFIHNKKGLTLTELLVSSILVGIIMIGVVSFNFAMKRVEDTTSSTAILTAEAAAFMAMIKKDAEKAVGDTTSNGSGVRTFSAGNNRCICFRHDFDNNPRTYTGDRWVCYRKWGSNNVTRKAFTDTTVPVNNNSCTANSNSTLMDNLIELSSVDFYDVPNGCDDCNPGNNTMDYITIAFTAIRNSANAVDTLRNPTVSLQTRVNPVGHSRN